MQGIFCLYKLSSNVNELMDHTTLLRKIHTLSEAILGWSVC